ncbi:MAG: hypothetical protein Q4F99_04400 [bacterium]|nr:hypothetical protein [bacterium]
MSNLFNKWMRSSYFWASVAFLLYTLFHFTVAPWLYPGASIHALIDVLGLNNTTTSHLSAPLTEATLTGIRFIAPESHLIESFNFATVLFGTLNVFLLGCTLTAIIKIFLEHSPSKAYTTRLLTWALPIASLLFLTTPEVLRAATHFQVQTFQLTFILFATTLTLRAIQNEKANGFFLSSLVLTLVALESKESLIVSFVLFIATLICYYLTVGKLSVKVLFKTFALPAIFALLLLFGLCEGFSYTLPSVMAARYYELPAMFLMTGGLLVVTLSLLPLLVALSMLHRTSLNIRTFQLLVIYLTLTIVATVAILPTSYHPVRLLGEDQRETYPLVMITCMALTMGLLMAMTTAFRVIRRPAEGGEDNGLQRHRLRLLSIAVTVVLPLLVLVLAGLSTVSTFVMDRAHTHTTCDILDQKIDAFGKDYIWIIDDSMMAQCVALRCHKRNIHWITFISPEALLKPVSKESEIYQLILSSELLSHYLSEQEQNDLLHYAELNGQVFLKALVEKCPQVLTAIHSFVPSTLWEELSSSAMPLHMLYTGTSFVGVPMQALDQHRLMKVSPAAPIAEDCLAYPQDIGFRNFIKNTRQEACNFHLEAAATLAQMRLEACNALALEHLAAAYTCDPEKIESTRDGILTYLKDNILALQGVAIPSALSLKNGALNDASMAAGSPLVLDDAHRMHNLDWLILYPSYAYYMKTRERGAKALSMPAYQQLRYQNLAQQEKPKLSAEEEASLREKYQKAISLERLAHYHMKQTQDLEAARQAIDELEVLLDPIDVSYLRAFYWNLKGDSQQALAALETFLSRYPNYIEALALLATIQLEAGKIEEIKLKTLPRIRSAAGSEKNYYYYIIKAQIAERQLRLQEARTAFLQAIEANPRDINARVKETVLTLDMRLQDAAAAKKHASDFLKRDLDFPFAHYVLGSIALSENNLPTATFHLEQASLKAENPLPMAYNDLAELCRRKGEFERACSYAIAAYQRDPNLVIAHETAASAAIALKRYAQAEQELNTAIETSLKLAPHQPVDARIRLTRAILFAKTNRLVQARQELKNVNAQQLDETSLREYEALRKTLQ